MGKEQNYVIGTDFEKQIVGELPITMKGVNKVREAISKCSGVSPEYFKRIGQATKNENGDIRVNNQTWEVKHIGSDTSSKGTYLNTSMASMNNYVDKPYSYFANKAGLYDYWEFEFGNKYPVRNRTSPITNYLEADDFRHYDKEHYKVIRKLDRQVRQEYVNYCFEYFRTHTDVLLRFVSDILSKGISNKQPPDYLLIYNEARDSVQIIDKETILNRSSSNFSMSKNKLALLFDGFRINFGWQNGNGLCNPTLRVFLK